MRKIKIAQIGAGHDHSVATIITLKLLDKEGLFDLVGYCTVPEDVKNPTMFAPDNIHREFDSVRRMTLDEILNCDGLDAVVIETEDRALTKYALMAAEKGLNIQMDKPGGIDGDEFDRLIDTVKQKKLVFHTGYMYRYNPAVLKLRKDISDGRLGDIISVEAQMNCRHGIEKRNWLAHYPGGMLYFLGCHMIDLVYSIMGEPDGIIPLSCSSGIDGTVAKDFGMAVFKYKHGISFAKSSAVEVGGFERRQLVVVGTKGTVELCPFEWLSQERINAFSPQVTGVREAFSESWHVKGERSESPVHGRYDAMLRAFASYVSGDNKNPFDYEYERNLHRILLKACGVE